ncbi:MAG: hypothetical protein AAGI38_09330 [Bacteroidota bacterium]
MKWLSHICGVQRDTYMTLADQALVSGSNFLLGILLTRALGLEAYGIYALVWMGMTFVGGIQQTLVLAPMMSLGPKESPENQPAYWRATWTINACLSLAGGGLAMLAIATAPWWNGGPLPDYLLTYLPLAVIVYLIQEYLRRYFFIRSQVLWALLVDLVAYLGLLAFIGICWIAGELTLEAVFLGFCGAYGSSSLLGWAASRLTTVSKKKFTHQFKRHWVFGRWLVGTSILQFFSGNFFIIAAGTLSGTGAVGALRMVQNLMGVAHVLFLAMENFVPVRAAASMAEGGIAGLQAYLKQATFKLGGVLGGLLLIVGVAAPWLLGWCYGAEHASYAYLVRGFCLLYILTFTGFIFRYYLRSVEYTFPIFLAYVLSTAFSVIAAYPMVGQFGLMGVIYGMGTAQLVVHLCYLISLKKRLPALRQEA